MTLKRKYGFWDFFSIPLKAAPVTTTLLFVVNLFEALIPAINVLAIAKFIDTALGVLSGTALLGDVFAPILIIIAIIIFDQTNSVFFEIFYVKLTLQLEAEFKGMIIEKRAKLHYSHIENNESWDLIRRVSENSARKALIGFDRIKAVISLAVRIGSLLTIILTQVWWVGLLAFIIVIPIITISLKGGKRNYDAQKESTPFKRRYDYLGKLLTDRENIEERTTFSYTDKVSKTWSENFNKMFKIITSAELKTSLNGRILGILALLMGITVAAALLPAVAENLITVGMFMSIVTAIFSLSKDLSWSLSYYIVDIVASMEYLKDLNKFSALSEHENANDLPDKLEGFSLKNLEFRNVSFKYPETERYILKNCSFQIDNGVHYAFVGINGAGKTTITKLLTGMYDNYEGDIFINDENLRDYKISELKAIFSVVYQDFAKYYMTFEDNIMLGNVLEHDEKKMQSIIKKLDLSDVVQKLPQKEKTFLGKVHENGVDLSGGEWQRLAIARTLYSNAKMYILDEPTAALDPVAESKVYDMFGEISEGMTTVFITHRLGAARLADKIFVIDDGYIKEQGSHDELIAVTGIYAEMFDKQKGWYEDVKA